MTNGRKEVTIELKTTIHDIETGDKETQKQSFSGELIAQGKFDVLKFTEVLEDGQKIQNMITIQPERVAIRRSGAIKMNQQFQENSRTENIYQHMHGSMRMETFTNRISFEKEKDDKGNLQMDYNMKLNGQLEREHRLVLTFS
ncbi:DUF1934 domain-containing protein [Oceanobacillus kimchii]|uniref:Beta-barrel protein YwiB n=1 Tax=Oceanobacillus kimchii TaxID=746691 RepID=A0ABQ5TML3_9BACI|nr:MULTISPECIES: DUF1934 domain-containing protein [Oceanobacillus]MBT2599480.1 DUF1934 domain-containing protein [Oceanobacillus sp. ISL-74]MCT1576666.1 DUF1934 domain-containing protein [Oceanobacillus kimchii]MCT2134736.1 DUF1934 domain-containing protein [Oceanobacillus kimchii]OEH56035.1 hypothetical protein AQ616_00515 [Oceanobacillus sp. E9]GLO67700.1 putative beta-barrel protein YwiB [Oceanobacillus kimchii]